MTDSNFQPDSDNNPNPFSSPKTDSLKKRNHFRPETETAILLARIALFITGSIQIFFNSILLHRAYSSDTPDILIVGLFLLVVGILLILSGILINRKPIVCCIAGLVLTTASYILNSYLRMDDQRAGFSMTIVVAIGVGFLLVRAFMLVQADQQKVSNN